MHREVRRGLRVHGKEVKKKKKKGKKEKGTMMDKKKQLWE